MIYRLLLLLRNRVLADRRELFCYYFAVRKRVKTSRVCVLLSVDAIRGRGHVRVRGRNCQTTRQSERR